jgi:hypothetical protein
MNERPDEADRRTELLAAMYRALDFLLGREIERSRTGISSTDTYAQAERLRDELRRLALPRS